jgi:hypothetical protein
MTSDDERWERDLRSGLGVLLDDVRPGQPPVAAVLRKGRAMRWSRRLALAGGVVVAAAAVVIAPALRGGGQPPVPRVGKDGVIAVGRIQGRLWRIVVDQKAGRLCAGELGLQQSCVRLRGLEHLSGLASLSGTSVAVDMHPPLSSNGPPSWNALFGVVRPDVTKVAMLLSSGRTVNLQPVAAAGYRWVGLVLPPFRVSVAKATAYSGTRELGYSVPFYGGELRPGTYFVSWYRPGETVPAQRGRYIASSGPDGASSGPDGNGGWDAYVDAGAWGYCVLLDAPVADGAQQNCWSPAALRAHPQVIMRGGSLSTVPRWIVATAGPSVAYMHMALANGRSVNVPVAAFSGQGFYAMQIGPGPSIVRWGAYTAAGHRLYGGLGPPDGGS